MSEPNETAVVTLRDMTAADWPDVARIYAEGIATGQALHGQWRDTVLLERRSPRVG